MQLQRRIAVALVRRHMLENGLEQRRHILPPLLAGRSLFQARPAVDAAGVHHGKVQLFICRAQFVEQVKRGIDNLVGIGSGFVHLVHHHDGAQAQRQRLLGHKTGLRHGAFLRIDQQHHPIDHAQGTLHLATKVRVAGRIQNVDVRALPIDSAVLCQNGDAAFTLDGVVVHHGIDHFFVIGKCAGLTQQLIDHGGFTMVNVGDDGDIADLISHDCFQSVF